MAAELVDPPGAHLEALGVSCATESTPVVWVLCKVELVDRCEVKVCVLVLKRGEDGVGNFFHLFFAFGFGVVRV